MERTVLWGHHLEEYRDMFDLQESSFSMRFLEFQCGPSAFQYDLRGRSAHLVSYDDWFCLDKKAISGQIEESFETRLVQISAQPQSFNFSRYGGLEALVAYRREGVAHFLQDYDLGHAEGRYLPAATKTLAFEPFFFDYALSAHHFFSSIVPQTVEYHLTLLKELARVAKEVRIFPLVDANGVPSPLLGPVILALQQQHFGVEVREVSYQVQPKGNAMLRLWAQACQV